jgi:serine/threonine-protein kinase
MADTSIPPPFRPGSLVGGKYRIDRVMAQGGMGVVLAAHHVGLNHRVALKGLLPHRSRPVDAARFLREARAAVRIESEHVVKVFDVGVEDGHPYLAMERLEGRDLGDELRARGALPVEEAVDCVLQALDAVNEAHALGIVHRDLKPSNLFLAQRADGSRIVKVLDFGIAKASSDDLGLESIDQTASDAFVGSPMFAAPEQLRGRDAVDARTDIWALGVVLYLLITGRPPFAGESVSALFAAILSDDPAPMRAARSDVPDALEALVRRCLARNPADRLPSAAALAEELAAFSGPFGASALARVRRLAARATLPPAAIATPDGSARAARAASADDGRSAGSLAASSASSSSSSSSSLDLAFLPTEVALDTGSAAPIATAVAPERTATDDASVHAVRPRRSPTDAGGRNSRTTRIAVAVMLSASAASVWWIVERGDEERAAIRAADVDVAAMADVWGAADRAEPADAGAQADDVGGARGVVASRLADAEATSPAPAPAPAPALAPSADRARSSPVDAGPARGSSPPRAPAGKGPTPSRPPPDLPPEVFESWK